MGEGESGEGFVLFSDCEIIRKIDDGKRNEG